MICMHKSGRSECTLIIYKRNLTNRFAKDCSSETGLGHNNNLKLIGMSYVYYVTMEIKCPFTTILKKEINGVKILHLYSKYVVFIQS